MENVSYLLAMVLSNRFRLLQETFDKGQLLIEFE
jgi:hypothetical protein